MKVLEKGVLHDSGLSRLSKMMIIIQFYLVTTLVHLKVVSFGQSSIIHHYGKNGTAFPQVTAIQSYDLRG